jgi:peptidoglycan/LPS O-acetylase OafA/YrhL
MSHPNPHLAYRADIDGLRAIAVLAVVAFHAFPAALPGGFVGVDIFFVISGYLISAIIIKALGRGEFSFADFYARRIRRIFPALLVTVSSCVAIGWSVLLPHEYAQLGKHAIAGIGFVANFVFWQEAGYFDTDAEFKPLLHLWSLGIEEQFYIVWPALALVVWKARRDLGAALLALAAVSLLASVLLSGTFPVASYFLPPTRVWELLFGALLAWRLQRHGAIFPPDAMWAPGVVSLLGGLLIAGGLVAIDKTRQFPGAWALLPVCGAVLLIAAGPRALLNRSVLASRMMVGIGLISFPLYLWHWPLLSFVRIALGEQVTPAWLLGALALAVLASWLTYRFVETPVRRSSGRWTVAILLGLGVIVAAVSANILVRGGLTFRLKDAQATNEARALAWDDHLRGGVECVGVLPAGMPGECLIADPRVGPTAMILGDSHANHYYWALGEALGRHGVNLIQLSGGGCVPLYGMAILKAGRLLDCRPMVDAAVDYLVRTPGIDTVLLGGRWMSYASGRELRDPPGHVSDETLHLPGQVGTDHLGRAEIFTRALDETLRRLTAAGKRVVFLHAIPELPFNARDCVTWRPNGFVNRTPRPDCRFSRALHDARSLEFRPLLDAVLAKYPTIRVFDPVPLLCDEQSCYGRRDGLLLYRDDDHLSLDGAYWLGRQLPPRLPALLGREVVPAGSGGAAGGL